MADEAKAKYSSVNGQWPEGTRDGRDLKPTPKEALAAAKRLYRVGFKRHFRGKMKLTSGNRRTWIRSGVFYVNPDLGAGTIDYRSRGGVIIDRGSGGGWHELVHDISHYVTRRLYGDAHGFRHAFIEKEMIKAVVEGGWLEGKLIRPTKPKPPVDEKALKLQRTLASIKRWRAKEKRAQTALRKLTRKSRYYERQLQA
jgi:hypothetical protein